MISDFNFYVLQNRLSGFYVISIFGTLQREAEERSDGETIPVKQNTLLKLSPKIALVNFILIIYNYLRAVDYILKVLSFSSWSKENKAVDVSFALDLITILKT